MWLRARAIESELRRTVEDLELLRGGAVRSVSIGVSMAAPLEFVARAVASVHRREPSLQVQIFEGVQAKIIADVRQGVVDFAIIPVAQRDALIDLRSRPLFHTRVVVVGRAGHPRAPAQSLAQLAACHWITPRRSGVLDGMVERLAVSNHLPRFSRPIQCDSSALYSDLIASTDLVGLSLATKLESDTVAGARIVYDGPPLPEVPVALVHRADFPQNALAGELAERCREEAAIHAHRRPKPAPSAASTLR